MQKNTDYLIDFREELYNEFILSVFISFGWRLFTSCCLWWFQEDAIWKNPVIKQKKKTFLRNVFTVKPYFESTRFKTIQPAISEATLGQFTFYGKFNL